MAEVTTEQLLAEATANAQVIKDLATDMTEIVANVKQLLTGAITSADKIDKIQAEVLKTATAVSNSKKASESIVASIKEVAETAKTILPTGDKDYVLDEEKQSMVLKEKTADTEQ